MKRTWPRLARKTLFYFCILAAIVYTAFPVYWALNMSFMPETKVGEIPVNYAPAPPTLENYGRVLGESIYLAALRNSVIVAGGATLLSLVIGSLAACAIGRFRFRGRRLMLYLTLSMTMFPQIAVVGALYQMIVSAGLHNTRSGLILTYLLTTLPFTVWVLASFFRSLPRELEESAYVDGASPLQTFWLILLPLAAPGLVTTGLLAFIQSWNEYLFALSFTVDKSAKTVPVVIAQFPGQSQHHIPYGEIMAGSLIATVPLILLVLIFQRRIVSGMTAGSVKG